MGNIINITVNIPIGRPFRAQRRSGVNKGIYVSCVRPGDDCIVVYLPRSRYRRRYDSKAFLARYMLIETRCQ